MFKSALKLVASSLSIWDSKLAVKYQEKQLKLTQEYTQALRATPMDNGVVDELEDQIKLLTDLVASEIAKA